MKQKVHSGIRLLAASAIIFSGSLVLAQAPDNTKANKSDKVTADNQKNDSADRELTQKIRKAIEDDKTLSTYAHNVKIITRAGKVTLKGPVRSEEEKTTVEAKAKEVAGADNVISQITVKKGKTKSES